jgi:transcriptional regulator with XRE-family HTH domain
MEIRKVFAERLKRQRMRQGMNQLELSEASGVPYQVISRLEHGHQSLYMERIAELAKVLETSLDYLVGFTDDYNPPKKPPRARKVAPVG